MLHGQCHRAGWAPRVHAIAVKVSGQMRTPTLKNQKGVSWGAHVFHAQDFAITSQNRLEAGKTSSEVFFSTDLFPEEILHAVPVHKLRRPKSPRSPGRFSRTEAGGWGEREEVPRAFSKECTDWTFMPAWLSRLYNQRRSRLRTAAAGDWRLRLWQGRGHGPRKSRHSAPAVVQLARGRPSALFFFFPHAFLRQQ